MEQQQYFQANGSRFPDEAKNFVQFYTKTKENKSKTAAAGHPIHDEVEMIWIQFPGDPKNDHQVPVHSQTKRMGQMVTYADIYKELYEAWRAGQEFHGSGTPLSEAPFLSEAKRADLKALSIHTVEALADLDGAELKRIGMGGRELKNKAKAYLGTAENVAVAAELAATQDELSALRAEMDALKQAQTMPATPEPPQEATPFDGWKDEDIKAWLENEAQVTVDGRWSRATLLAEATLQNEEMRKANDGS